MLYKDFNSAEKALFDHIKVIRDRMISHQLSDDIIQSRDEFNEDNPIYHESIQPLRDAVEALRAGYYKNYRDEEAA